MTDSLALARGQSEPEDYDEVVRRCKNGNVAAWKSIVQRHSDTVSRLVFQITRSRTATEDLSQETFVRVYKAIHSFDPDGKATFQTWIFRIALNVALDYLRKTRRERERTQEFVETASQPADGFNCPFPSQEESLIEKETEAAVLKAVDSLSECLRVVVILRLGGSSPEEVASMLGIKTNAANVRYFRGLKQIEALLKR